MKNETDAPCITIGICCYNSEDTVQRAINSAINQNYSNFEVLVIDDGSSDSTPDVIKKTIEGVSNARFIQHDTNKTFPGALNTVIKEARGEFIAIFDDDDESSADRISIQRRTIEEYEVKTGAKLVACWGSGVRRYPNGYELELNAIGSRPRNPIGSEIADLILFYGKPKDVFYGAGTPSCSLMARKSVFKEVGPYDETMFRSEDADFAIRLGLKGGHFIGCKERVLVQHATGGAEKKPEVTYNSYQMILEKYDDYLISKGRKSYAHLWNKLRLYHFSQKKLSAIQILIVLLLKHPILTISHLLSTAPKRVAHEIKMAR